MKNKRNSSSRSYLVSSPHVALCHRFRAIEVTLKLTHHRIAPLSVSFHSVPDSLLFSSLPSSPHILPLSLCVSFLVLFQSILIQAPGIVSFPLLLFHPMLLSLASLDSPCGRSKAEQRWCHLSRAHELPDHPRFSPSYLPALLVDLSSLLYPCAMDEQDLVCVYSGLQSIVQVSVGLGHFYELEACTSNGVS